VILCPHDRTAVRRGVGTSGFPAACHSETVWAYACVPHEQGNAMGEERKTRY